MIKGAIQQEDITLVNIYAPNIRAPEYVKQILMNIKRGTDRNTIIVEDFNSPLISMYKSSRQKIGKETASLNDTLDQMYLIDIFRMFHPRAAEYTFFQVNMKYFLEQTTYQGTKQISINLRRLKSNQASSMTKML